MGKSIWASLAIWTRTQQSFLRQVPATRLAKRLQRFFDELVKCSGDQRRLAAIEIFDVEVDAIIQVDLLGGQMPGLDEQIIIHRSLRLKLGDDRRALACRNRHEPATPETAFKRNLAGRFPQRLANLSLGTPERSLAVVLDQQGFMITLETGSAYEQCARAREKPHILPPLPPSCLSGGVAPPTRMT